MDHNETIAGKTALVTGATGGLGAAIARRLAAAGAGLVVTGRRSVELTALVSVTGGEMVVADLADPSALQKVAARAAEVDILVANAALPAAGELATFTAAELDRALDVNLRAPMHMAQAAAPAMAGRGGGHIVLVSSMGAKLPSPALAVYTATKAGMRGFGLALREELRGSGVGVSVINPGPIRDAGMWADTGLGTPPGAGSRTAEDVANAVVRAIEDDTGEIDVASAMLRMSAWLAALTPRAYAALARRAGAERHTRAMVERIGHRR